MNQVLGKNVVCALLIAGDYYPIFCGKSATLTINQDEIETTFINSGANREFVPGMSDATLDIDGVTVLDNSEGRVSILYLMQLSIRRVIQSLRMLFTDQDGNQVGATFNAFTKTTQATRNVVEWSQSLSSLRITGPITFSAIIDPPVPQSCEEEDPIWTTLAEAATTVVDALLIPAIGETITILGVTRSGLSYTQVSGTPGNLQFQYTSGTGTITFRDAGSPALPDLEPVSINYKKEV